ncbi:MAG: putative arsenate reductase [Chlamydiia bacterium]|nr:putative arsenate reductase [Chlamydiia bacterium]
MDILIYLYSKCSTCKSALHFLQQRKISYTLKEITTTPPSITELQKMLTFKSGDIKKLFNTSGILYREYNLTEKLPNMTVDEALKLLQSNGMLVKRPFLLAADFGLLGFREKEWLQAFPKE